jgi:hypothetical protein
VQSKPDNPEKLATLGTQDEEKQNTTQPRETGNIGYTRRRKTKQKHNPEKLATLGTQDEEKQNKNTTPLYANKHK